MFNTRIFLVAFIFMGFIQSVSKAETLKIIASSGKSKVTLVELFSSESCSSCPPADNWISGLESHKDLWSKFVPIVFHIDYWNHLSWKDELSSSEMTARQVAISKTWLYPSVYTPAVVLSGAEWRGWRESKLDAQLSNAASGLVLQIVKNSKGQFQVKVSGQKTGTKYTVNLAKIGMGISTKITDGENSGKTLNHNFVVLDWQKQILNSSQLQTNPIDFLTTNLKLKKAAQKFAVVAWIEEVGQPIALQATGAYL
jgi:hypothetical protein